MPFSSESIVCLALRHRFLKPSGTKIKTSGHLSREKAAGFELGRTCVAFKAFSVAQSSHRFRCYLENRVHPMVFEVFRTENIESWLRKTGKLALRKSPTGVVRKGSILFKNYVAMINKFRCIPFVFNNHLWVLRLSPPPKISYCGG